MHRTFALRSLFFLLMAFSVFASPDLRAEQHAESDSPRSETEAETEEPPPKRKKAPEATQDDKSPKKRATTGNRAESTLPDLPRNISDVPATESPDVDEAPTANPSAPTKRKVEEEPPSKKRSDARKKRPDKRPRRRAPPAPDDSPSPAGETCGEQCSQACAGACIEIGCQLCTGWCPLGVVLGGLGVGVTGAGLGYFGTRMLQSPSMDESARQQEAAQSAWVGALVGAGIGAIVGGSTGIALNIVDQARKNQWLPCVCPPS